MRAEFEEVLLLQTEYSDRNTPEMERRGRLIRTIIADQLRAELSALSVASGIVDLRVEGRDGTGRKTEIPWTRVHSLSRARRATEGWYVVYLFSAAGDRAYLSLMQATTRWNGVEFRPRPDHELEARVQWARQLLSHQSDYPADWVDTIRLDSQRGKLGKGYEKGSVIAAEYPLDSIPSDAQLRADLAKAVRWLSVIYAATDEGLWVPGEPGPEVVDAEVAIELNAGKARRGGQGFRLTTAEKKAVEMRAVAVVSQHLEYLGYVVKDVGLTESYDLDARKGAGQLFVEVKGTTSTGEEVILTSNEVKLHEEHYPNNALGIVHSIELDRTVSPPIADKGVLVLTSPWQIDPAHLVPMSYRYTTGLSKATADVV